MKYIISPLVEFSPHGPISYIASIFSLNISKKHCWIRYLIHLPILDQVMCVYVCVSINCNFSKPDYHIVHTFLPSYFNSYHPMF